MATEPTPQFINAIAAAVEYWRRRTETLDDAAIARLDEDRQNLYRAVEFGLKRPETWEAAAEVALQAFDLVERRGYWREWMPMLEAAVVRCSYEHQELKCRLLNRLGFFYRRERQLDIALITHQEAEALAQAMDDQQMLAETFFYLSGDYLEKHEYGRAEQYALTALANWEESKTGWVAATYITLGEIAQHRGDLTLAEERYLQSVVLRRTLNEPLRLARGLSDLAGALLGNEKLREAQRCYQEAIDLLATTPYELDKVNVQNNLGVLYYRRGQWAAAEAAFRQADSIYLHQSPHIEYRASVKNNLGNVLLKQGLLYEAETYLQSALILWQQANNDVQFANTLGAVGKILVARREIDSALARFDEAITLLARYPDNAWAQRLLREYTEQRDSIKDK